MIEQFQTTFWQDFTIADSFGLDAIQETFNRAFAEWKDDKVYMTEMVVVLNWKIWSHYENHNADKAELYDKLWREADDYALEHFKGEDLEYFLNITD